MDIDAGNADTNTTPVTDAAPHVEDTPTVPDSAELVRLAADAAKAELDGIKSDLFAKIEALNAKIEEQAKPVPVTDSRKPNNTPVSPDYAALSAVHKLAAGYKS